MKKYYRKYNGRFDKKSDPREFWCLLGVVLFAVALSYTLPKEPVQACGLDSVVCPGEVVQNVVEEKALPTLTPVNGEKGNISSPATNLSLEKQLSDLADKRHFPYKSYLIRLAKCESRFNPKARNVNTNGLGTDRGLFQINNHFHPDVTDKEADDVVWAANWTMDMIESGYQHRWSCDKIIKGNLNY